MTKSNSTNKSRRNTKTTGRTTTARKTAGNTTAVPKTANKQDMELWYEVGLIVLFAFMVFLFLCNFNLVGPIGVFFKNIMFGLFGLMAYIMPALLFVVFLFSWINKGHPSVRRKVAAGSILYLTLCAVCELFAGRLADMDSYAITAFYKNSVTHLNGGGVFGGSLAYLLNSLFAVWGSVLILLVLMIICIVLITERSFVRGVQKTGRAVVNKARTDAQGMREYAAERAKLREEERYEQLKLKEEQLNSGEPVHDRNRKVTGINFNSIFSKLGGKEMDEEPAQSLEETGQDRGQDISSAQEAEEASSAAIIQNVFTKSSGSAAAHPTRTEAAQGAETVAAQALPETDELHELRPKTAYHTRERINFVSLEPSKKEPAYQAPVHTAAQEDLWDEEETETEAPVGGQAPVELTYSNEQPQMKLVEASKAERDTRPVAKPAEKQTISSTKSVVSPSKPYLFPPVSLLQKGKSSNPRDGQKHLEETARRLQECLKTFGVNVTITDISQGPAVTRYELQPEQGVKVSRIVNLSDDIKLNLAATDIRIEAPIPGKSAIGIEVPNKENSAVAFRELIETQEFQSFPSKIAFAVGKDIAGKVVVSDIAKMPHMLIAGSTGSGKSVCINTLIMSILYKAHPDEVKLIMIDPKVVELSSYNGIPHLLIPVVTDPKQAAGALQWGVSEMMSRYEKFAELNVRDMKGYNAKIDERAAKGEENLPKKLPQIVIIVDELADLMMVAPGEVEESICRLAQLARAAGIHLIIATQRPSVDVITGLIKANMPSRVAFAVSSGVDSRTILDMNGAEKLLGKGDMLFYPQGYSKPVRVQGSFVSDAEVGAVVDYLKNQQLGNVYQEEIQNQINNLNAGAGNASGGAGARSDDRDALFADAGRFIIEKDKASIGMLQRVFKIGFNRAARIVDQLCEHGVVGEEEGTKPRKVLMSMEQFENLLEEI